MELEIKSRFRDLKFQGVGEAIEESTDLSIFSELACYSNSNRESCQL